MKWETQYKDLLYANDPANNLLVFYWLQQDLGWAPTQCLEWILDQLLLKLSDPNEPFRLYFGAVTLEIEFKELWAHEKINASWSEMTPHYTLYRDAVYVWTKEGWPPLSYDTIEDLQAHLPLIKKDLQPFLPLFCEHLMDSKS